MIMNDKLYDTLARTQRFVIPFGTFIIAIMGIWGVSEINIERATATLSAISVLLAAWLNACSKKYFDTGTIIFPNIEKDGDTE